MVCFSGSLYCEFFARLSGVDWLNLIPLLILGAFPMNIGLIGYTEGNAILIHSHR